MRMQWFSFVIVPILRDTDSTLIWNGYGGLFQEQPFSSENLCICHAQLVYILSLNVNARNANYDAMSFLCVSTDLVG